MPEGKIEVTIGDISFVGEGEQNWVAEQLDKIIEKAPDLVKIAPKKKKGVQPNIPPEIPAESDNSEDAAISQKTLPAFLAEKNAKTSQVIKFLATAIWLHAKGSRRLRTGDITSAISNANQTRFSNPSNCLASNVKKGFIEKTGSEFFVTDDGKASLL
jgi:hypothetical protein